MNGFSTLTCPKFLLKSEQADQVHLEEVVNSIGNNAKAVVSVEVDDKHNDVEENVNVLDVVVVKKSLARQLRFRERHRK